jgi:hypothetical protein
MKDENKEELKFLHRLTDFKNLNKKKIRHRLFDLEDQSVIFVFNDKTFIRFTKTEILSVLKPDN